MVSGTFPHELLFKVMHSFFVRKRAKTFIASFNAHVVEEEETVQVTVPFRVVNAKGKSKHA